MVTKLSNLNIHNMNVKEEVEKAKNGSEKAFTNLYNEFQKVIYVAIYNIVKNKEVAEDLTSETFIKIYKNLHKYTKDFSFVMWAKTIANHHAIDYIRSGKNQYNTQSLDDEMANVIEISDYTDPETSLINKEMALLENDAIKSLTKREYEIVKLREEEIPYSKIAEELGVSIGTVKSSIHNYRKKIKKYITKKE